jgi:hypothetical protein
MTTVVDEWIPVSRLAKMAGVHEATARRYVENFPQFFPLKKQSRKNLVPASTGKILKRIWNLYNSGMNKGDIESALESEFKKTYDAGTFSGEIKVENETVLASLSSEPLLLRLVEGIEKLAQNQQDSLNLLREQNNLLLDYCKKLSGKNSIIGNKLDRKSALEKVSELSKQGFGKDKIAKILNNNNTNTLSGRGRWSSSTVDRLIKQLKINGDM